MIKVYAGMKELSIEKKYFSLLTVLEISKKLRLFF